MIAAVLRLPVNHGGVVQPVTAGYHESRYHESGYHESG